jgi:hypothetical protein
MSKQDTSLTVVTIVPPAKSNPTGPHLVMGTKVLLSDGSELGGVQSVELKASVETGIWQAVITVLPREVPQIDAETALTQIEECTALSDDCRQYRRVKA